MSDPQSLIEKIKSLPPERVEEIEDFVDFLASRAHRRGLTRDAMRASESAFSKHWNNPDDDVYDNL